MSVNVLWTREDSNCVPGTQSFRTGLCEAVFGSKSSILAAFLLS
jgi:hypothetical protein